MIICFQMSSYLKPLLTASKRGREPLDAMSLRYADTSLTDLLGRPNLHYADQASAMQTVPLLCNKRASTIQHSFFKSWFLCEMKNVNNFF